MVMTDSVLFLDIADVMETAGKVVVAQSPGHYKFYLDKSQVHLSTISYLLISSIFSMYISSNNLSSIDCSRFLRKDSGKLVDDEGDYGSARSLLLSASVTVLFLTLALLSTYYP